MKLDPLSRIGKRVAGRYRVVSELSRGGMGIVYRAVQEPLEREIALKIMLPGPAADQTLRRRFIHEAQALSRTVHPNIVTIFDFGEVEDGSIFIAMELVAGKNLRELAQSGGKVPWRDTLQMIIGATRALAAAHSQGISHRDLKPDNIMLVGNRWRADDVKLLDFGLARTLGESEGLTQINVIPGTPHYIAPERVASRTEDPRSDLYALGAIWFELLTGRLPFEGDTVAAILLAHVQKAVPRVSAVAPQQGVPAELEQMVARLLSKSPADRWPTAQALLADVEALAPRLKDNPALRAPSSASVPRPSRWTSSAANQLVPEAQSRTTPPAPASFPLTAAPAPPAGGEPKVAPSRPGPAPSRPAAAPPPSRPAAAAPASRPAVLAPASRPSSPAPAARAPSSHELKIGDEPIKLEQAYDAPTRRVAFAATFRGRLLRKVELQAPALPPNQLESWLSTARSDFSAGLKALAAKQPAVEPAPVPERAETRLFFFALDAWLSGDAQTALRTIESLRLALPEDVHLANTQKKLLLEMNE